VKVKLNNSQLTQNLGRVMASHDLPLDPKHAEFRTWAEKQGVQIDGVAPAKIPGKGIGMVATKKLEVHLLFHLIPAFLPRRDHNSFSG
jgi:hypothetical protein